MTDTTIEWTDKTWNPTTGCDKISPGCAHCYAEGVAKRFWGDRKFSDVQFHEDRLLQPLSWKKPQRIFVNSMSDLFHKKVTDEQLDQIFAVMALTLRHTYQVLTKRPERMQNYLRSDAKQRIRRTAVDIGRKLNLTAAFEPYETCQYDWPLPNVWLGVTTENQKTANERIPFLRHCPAAIRFLSCEPLLEPIELFDVDGEVSLAFQAMYEREMLFPADVIDWVIIGGESGHKARACKVDWIRSIVAQCQLAEVPVFVKQLGSYPVENFGKLELASKKGGDITEFPPELQIRQFPST